MTKDEERLAIEVEQWLPNEYETLVGVLNDRTTLRAVSKALSDQVHELRARLAELPSQAPADPVAEQLARLRATHGPEAPTGGDFDAWWLRCFGGDGVGRGRARKAWERANALYEKATKGRTETP